jgi:hypothetical protein
VTVAAGLPMSIINVYLIFINKVDDKMVRIEAASR